MRTSQRSRVLCCCGGVIFGTISWIGLALADTFRVCMGEDQANGCPVSHDAMFGCGVSIDQAASQLCAITQNGQKTVAPYNYVHQGSHEGGRCGYEWYSLNCRFQ
jgi:hypothetical protein